MLVTLSHPSTEAQSAAVKAAIRASRPTPCSPRPLRTAIPSTPAKPSSTRPFATSRRPGVHPVTKPWKLSAEVPESTVGVSARLTRQEIAGVRPAVRSPPSATTVEARMLPSTCVKSAGLPSWLGPRTPLAPGLLGEEALRTLAQVRRETGLPVVSEIIDAAAIESMVECVDVLQVGARNMQNFVLLKALAQQPRPVLLKRGPAATLTEWLMAAEYLLAGGKRDVLLCERGIRSFSDHSRNTLD
jgi:3-deoxy-7-phosphoheptulonate synthase